MSFTLMAKAMQIKVGNPTRKLILIKLADQANDNGECWPSLATIAKAAECDRRTVIRHIAALESAGLVMVQHRQSGEISDSNLYRITLSGSDTGSLGGDKLSLGGSDTGSLGVVTQCHPNLSIESINKNPLPPCGESPSGDVAGQTRSKAKLAIDYQAVADAYNEILGARLPQVASLNDKRKRQIKALQPQLSNPSLAGWRTYFEAFNEEAKPFYFGDNNRGWQANFDYLLRSDTMIKVREGSL